jgi:hypothetical protein
MVLKSGLTVIKGLTKSQILKDLRAKKLGQVGTFGWKGKAKNYPGAANIIRGMKKKGKPKLTMV